MGTGSPGTLYTVRQQLFTIHQDFEVHDASGARIMSAHGNGLRVMDKIDLCDAQGTPVLQIRERPGVRPHVDVESNGKKLISIGERRVGLKDRFVIETPMPAKFDIVGNVWSTRYTITINGETAAQVMMEPGLVKADTYDVLVAEGKAPRILFGIIIAVDILTHKGKR
ncbi:MAG: LURP-one-related family protein [Actinomycetia bacterium]|nr:LURP-one-related family protein [Actinomycetes bacterium]